MIRHPAAVELGMCSFWAGGISSFPFSRAREYRLLRRLLCNKYNQDHQLSTIIIAKKLLLPVRQHPILDIT
jgi:hypothetical protein